MTVQTVPTQLMLASSEKIQLIMYNTIWTAIECQH